MSDGKMPDNAAAFWSRGPVKATIRTDEGEWPRRLWTMHTKDGTPYRSRDDGPRLAWDYWPVPGLNPEWGTPYLLASTVEAECRELREKVEALGRDMDPGDSDRIAGYCGALIDILALLDTPAPPAIEKGEDE